MADPYSTGDVGAFVGTIGDARVDSLIWHGLKWGSDGAGTPAHLTYSFPKANAAWLSNYYDQEPFQNFQPFTAAQQTAAKKALSLWAEVANITFEQVAETSTNVGEMRFANSGAVTNSQFVAWAYGPYEQSGEAWPENGDVWLDKAYKYNHQLQPGQFGFATMLHEIGHALGLDHPFADTSDPNEPILPINWDDDVHTVMSYNANSDTRAFASTPQVLDILAIQYIYGANMNTRTGNDTYKFGTAEVSKTIWDAGGIDTLDFSNQRNGVSGELTEGTYFRFGGTTIETTSFVGIAYGVTIENVIGSNGNNWLSGNAADNRIVGGSKWDVLYGYDGNDTIIGGGGNDSMTGMDGDDFLDCGAGEDMVDGRDGNDTILAGSGNDAAVSGLLGDDFLDGETGADRLSGDEGNDTLIGGVGSDWMEGGEGNDLYEVNAIGDIVDEGTNVDTDDVVRSFIAVNLSTLGAGQIEHAILLGAAAISATGNDKDNQLIGNAGANKLDGSVGADTLIGGKGGDTYVVDNIGDQVIETIGGTSGGIDTVQSSIDFSLAALVNVEKLTLLAGFGDIDGTGNALNNTLAGNGGANILNGLGGKDAMAGGAGNDYYFVDNPYDVVTETILNGKGGGIDTVESSVTYSLAVRANVDHLILTGIANSNGTGNALNNEITGNLGNNLLIGGTGNDILTGGDGNDKLTGGTGNDIFNFNLVSELGDLDIITDFKKTLDRIDIAGLLDDALYAGSDIFGDGIVTFTYDKTTTNIWFDSDGTAGGGAASSLASLLNVNLTSADSSSFIV